MTITLYLYKETILKDLVTLKTIFDAGIPELANPLSGFLQNINISTDPKPGFNAIAIQVTPEEFALIGVFNGGI